MVLSTKINRKEIVRILGRSVRNSKIRMETTIAIAIVLFIITMVIVMFWSVTVSKQLSIVVFGVIFISIAVTMIIWQGFSQQAFENIGFIALVLFVWWFRISKS